ncbi:MAG: LytR C-terminal domain-containing protein [Acidimicrobiia bacterium]
MSGKHAAPFRLGDFLTIIGGVAVVAGLVYLGLTALLGGTPTTTSTSTTATPTSTTIASTTTSTSPSSTTTSATTSTTVAIRPPGEVRVLVLNSLGVDGLATQVSNELADLGYTMLTPDNYSPLLERSRVWFLPGFEAEAFVLAAELPDALIEENPDLAVEADIVVVLGDSYES